MLGLVGTNGTSAILAGKLKPNSGKLDAPPDWQDILTYYRGSELQDSFTRVLEDNLKAIIKTQYVDRIRKAVRGNALDVIESKDVLELRQVCDRNVADLSGGELQRFAVVDSTNPRIRCLLSEKLTGACRASCASQAPAGFTGRRHRIRGFV